MKKILIIFPSNTIGKGEGRAKHKTTKKILSIIDFNLILVTPNFQSFTSRLYHNPTYVLLNDSKSLDIQSRVNETRSVESFWEYIFMISNLIHDAQGSYIIANWYQLLRIRLSFLVLGKSIKTLPAFPPISIAHLIESLIEPFKLSIYLPLLILYRIMSFLVSKI